MIGLLKIMASILFADSVLLSQFIEFDGATAMLDLPVEHGTEALRPTTHEKPNTTQNHMHLEVDSFPVKF